MILAVVAAAAFSIRVDWMRGGALASAEVYGGGAAIANDAVAMRLTQKEVARLQRAAAVVAAMPDHFGEKSSERVSVRGTVTTGGKTVVQYEEGEQSQKLAALAAEVLSVTEKAARARGVSARDLPDALAKLAKGAIPLEALHVAAQSRGEPGWLMQVQGNTITVRRYANESYGDPVRRQLSDRELRALVGALRDAKPWSFPRHLHAPAYTELRIDVLGRAVDLRARPANDETSKEFDRLIDYLAQVASPLTRPSATLFPLRGARESR
jgi:hypothetical protein